MDALKRWRQPAAFVVLGALLARLAIGIVGLFVFASSQGFDSFTLAASSIAFLLLDGAGLLLLALLVAACHLPEPTPRVRVLTGAAVAVSACSVLLTLAFAVVGLVASRISPPSNLVFNVFMLLLSLVAPTVTTIGLGLLWRHHAAAAHQPAAVRTGATAVPAQEPAAVTAPAVSPSSAPTWAPDEASGAVWHTAGAAAEGGAASAWGTPDGATGWNALPGPAAPAGELPAGPDWSPATPAAPDPSDRRHAWARPDPVPPPAWGSDPGPR